MTENKQIINVSEASYAFYIAGVAHGRVEAVKNVKEQLTKAASEYNSLVDKVITDENIRNESPIKELVEIIEGFGTLPDQISNQLIDLESNEVETLNKALSIEKKFTRKPPIDRISNAINGLIDGWNK